MQRGQHAHCFHIVLVIGCIRLKNDGLALVVQEDCHRLVGMLTKLEKRLEILQIERHLQLLHKVGLCLCDSGSVASTATSRRRIMVVVLWRCGRRWWRWYVTSPMIELRRVDRHLSLCHILRVDTVRVHIAVDTNLPLDILVHHG